MMEKNQWVEKPTAYQAASRIGILLALTVDLQNLHYIMVITEIWGHMNWGIFWVNITQRGKGNHLIVF